MTAWAKVAVSKAADTAAAAAAKAKAKAKAKEMEMVGVVATAGDEMEAAAIVLVVVTVAVATAAVATAVEEVEAVVLTDRVTARAGTPRKPARGRQHGLSKNRQDFIVHDANLTCPSQGARCEPRLRARAPPDRAALSPWLSPRSAAPAPSAPERARRLGAR